MMNILKTLNTFQSWFVERILNVLERYTISIPLESTKMALMQGRCNLENFQLNVQTIERELTLPFEIVSGRIQQLSIDIPWYRLLRNVPVVISSMEFVIKMKKYDKKNSEKFIELTLDKTPSTSCSEKYTYMMFRRILGHLSITCDNIIIKLIEDDIEFCVEIQLLTLIHNDATDDWEIKYNLEKVDDDHWKLQKSGDIVGLTVSANRINQPTNNYLDPLVFNIVLAIRLHCKFDSSNSIKPYLIHMDIFNEKEIIMIVTECQMYIIMDLLNSMKKYRSDDIKQHDERCKNVDNTDTFCSIAEIISRTENWTNWLNNWINDADNEILIDFLLINIGIYTNSLIIVLNFDNNNPLNEYKPSIKFTCNKLMLKIIHHPFHSKVIQLQINEIKINTENKCICGLQYCSNSKKLFLSPEKVIDTNYLRTSLFNEYFIDNEEKTAVSLFYSKRKNKKILETVPFFSFNYVYYYKTTKPSNITIEVEACCINLSYQIFNDLKFISDTFVDYVKSSKANTNRKDERNLVEECTTVVFPYSHKISNIIIKITPVCPNSKYVFRKTNSHPTTNEFPEIFIELNDLGGNFVISNTLKNAEKQTVITYNLSMKKIQIEVNKPGVKQAILYINKVAWSVNYRQHLNKEYDSSLNIGSVQFKSLKDDYLSFYYIIYSTFITNEPYMNDLIFNPDSQQNTNLNSALCVWNFDCINIHRITNDNHQVYNLEIKLEKISANMSTFGENDKLGSKIVSALNEDSCYPAFHAIVQFPAHGNAIHLPLIYVYTRSINIYINPIFLEWLMYIPEYTCTMEIQDNYVLSSSNASENKLQLVPMLMRWLYQWESTEIFIYFSTTVLYFPNKIVPASTHDTTLNMEKRLQLVAIEDDVDMLTMRMSNFTFESKMNDCALQRQNRSFDGFPVCLESNSTPEENETSLFPWNLELKQLECFRFSENKIKVFDAFDMLVTLTIESVIKNHSKLEINEFDGILKCTIPNEIVIYVSEQQIEMVDAIIKRISDILVIVSSNLKFANSENNYSIMDTTEKYTDDTISSISNFIDLQRGLARFSEKMESSVQEFHDNRNKCSLEISIDINGNSIIINFFKNLEGNKFEPLLYIRLYRPSIYSMWLENFAVCQIRLHNMVIHVPANKNTTTSCLPTEHDYEMICLYTDEKTRISGSKILEFLKVELFDKSFFGHPQVIIVFKKDICVNIDTITTNALLEIADMLNNRIGKPKDISACTTESLLNNYDVDDYSVSENTIESSYYIKWKVSIDSRKLVIQLLTETKDKIIFVVKRIHGKLDCIQEIEHKRMYGKITFDSIVVYSENFGFEDIILQPTEIIVETNWILLSSQDIRFSYKSNVTVSSVSIDLSKNNFNAILSIWNTYKYLRQTKHKYATPQTTQLNNRVHKIYYQNIFTVDTFEIVDVLDVYLPYQIIITNSCEKFEITWTYPQLRRLTRISIKSELIRRRAKHGLNIELYWYDVMKTPFCSCKISHLRSIKNHIFLLQLDEENGISSTWRMVINNKDLLLTYLEIRNLISSIKVDSYSSPNFVLISRIDVSIQSSKVSFLCDSEQSETVKRYKRVPKNIFKQAMAVLKLTHLKMNIHKTCTNEMVTSGKMCVSSLLFVHKKFMEFIAFPLNFTSFHSINPKRQNQYNIQTNAITCMISPSMINVLTPVTEFWMNCDQDVLPYVICNDTIYTIIFGQADTHEKVVLNRQQCYDYMWCIYDETHCLKFAVKINDNDNDDNNNDNDTLCWSDENVFLNDENKKYSLTVQDCHGQDVILIIHFRRMSRISVHVIITSTLRITNETEFGFNSNVIFAVNVDGQRHSRKHVLAVGSREITPSLTFKPDNCTLIISLQVLFGKNQWSDEITLLDDDADHRGNGTFSNVIEFPRSPGNDFSIAVLCHTIIKTIDGTPQTLILLLPPYMIISHMPINVTLAVTVLLDSVLEAGEFIVRSAVDQNNRNVNAQAAFLPIKSSYDNDDDGNLRILLDLNRKNRLSSMPINLSHKVKRTTHDGESNNCKFNVDKYFLDERYEPWENNDLKWPFIGKRFDNVQWRTQQEISYKTSTELRIQEYYKISDDDAKSTRLLTIQPWALMVNTSGLSISLHDTQTTVLEMDNMSVVVPPVLLYENGFSIKIDGKTSALITIDERYSLEDYVIRLNKRSDIVFNVSGNTIVTLSATVTAVQNMKVVHLQTMYVAANYSSTDVVVLPVCTAAVRVGSLDVFEIPECSKNATVAVLAGTSRNAGRPLTYWSTAETTADVVADKLDRYVMLTLSGGAACSYPIRLCDSWACNKGDDDGDAVDVLRTFPVVFSLADGPRPDVCVTLTKRDGYYVVSVHDLPYPHVVFRNDCRQTTMTVTNGHKYDNPVRFAANWNWSYDVTPGTTSHLSFPETELRGAGATVHVAAVMADGQPVRWLATMKLDGDACTTSNYNYAVPVRMMITKRAFTWHAVFYDKFGDVPADHREILASNDHRVSESLTLVNFQFRSMTLDLLDNEYYLKKMSTLIFENIITTIRPENKSNDNVVFRLSIDNIELINNMIDDHDGFEFPVIFSTKKIKVIKALPNKENAMRYLSDVMSLSNRSDPTISAVLVISKSSDSASDILDVDVLFSEFEVSIEDRYCHSLWKYLKSFNLTMPRSASPPEEHDFCAGESSVIIDELTSSCIVVPYNRMTIRTFRITSSPFILNMHWSFVHLNHSLISLPEFQKNNLTLLQLWQSAITHYYKGAKRNAGNAIVSMEQLGAPRNFTNLVNKGLRMFALRSANGFVHGPIQFLYGLTEGLSIFIKHVILGFLYTNRSMAMSWSRTLQNVSYLNCVAWPIVKGLSIAEQSSDIAIGYLLDSMDDGEVN